MPTPAQIDEQVKLEREAIRCGIDRLERDTKKAEEREYASSSIYGRASITAAQEAVAEAIRDTFTKRVLDGKNGQNYAEIKRYLIQFNSEEESNKLANIALKRTFDLVFSQKRKESKRSPNSVSNVCVGIGHAVEAECQIRWFEEQDPELLSRIQRKYWKSTTGTDQKKAVAQIMMGREGHVWPSWPAPIRARLGGWLLDLVITTTGWFEQTKSWSGSKSTTLIIPSDAYLEIQGELMEQAMLFAPMSWPMLIEPNDWTNTTAGGYLLNEVMRGHDLVRHGDPSLKQPKTPLEFLNRLQKVAYRINPFIYGVAKQLEEKGHKLAKFKPLSAAALWPMPTPPPDIEENQEARFQYRKERTEAENNKKKYERSLHVRTTVTLDIASKFLKRDRFFLPWSFDYRGRAYPIPPFLTPHDTDFGKSLIRFADEAFLTPEAEDWLAFQVATTYGLDKAPMSERLEWVANNLTLISSVAHDPIGTLPTWEAADEPWQFLAACEEYTACLIDCTRHYTGLMVATDATCSGLQILAGLARDKGTAALVNVLPSDAPQDAYKTVLEAMEDIPERLLPYMDRGVSKRSVMTIPYNATLQSSREYIKDAVHANMPKDSQGNLLVDRVSAEEATALAKSLRNALNKIAPGCLAVRDWIGKEMAAAIKRGKPDIRWVTPSGFTVIQRRDKLKMKRLDLKLLGRCQFNIVDQVEGPDSNKHKASGAPNLIHSLDASLLHLTFTDFLTPFSVIHDSVLCRATDMSILSTKVRETYMHLFAEHDYLTDWAKQIGAETEPPIIGDLEPESVLDSTYFFC
jgi:DNA-directed RNA polymerase